MDGKRYTIILVPHTRARFRKFQVSSTALWLVIGVCSVLLATAAAFGWAYLTSPVDQSAVAHLRHENSQLRQVNQHFEQSIRQLQGQLAAYEERTRKLAIVAGIEELDNGSDAGVGGGAATAPLSIAQINTRLQSMEQGL